MFNDPRFWLYWVLFFTAAGLTRLGIGLVGKKRCISYCLYFALSLVSLTMFWLFRENLSFHSPREGILFGLCALLPGVLGGLHFILLFLPLPLVIGSAIYFDLSIAPLIHENEKILGTLICYPGRENQLFVEWEGDRGKPVLGYLEGEKCSVCIRKTVLPDYLFFLENPWEVLGILSRNVNPSDLPSEVLAYYIPLQLAGDESTDFKTFEYPALKFLDPGYFNSYTFVIRSNRDLVIMERKSID